MVVIGYCSIGGAIFQWLEIENENETKINSRIQVSVLVKQHSAYLYSILDRKNYSQDLSVIVENLLKNISRDAFTVGTTTNWDGEMEGAPIVLDWTFPGAVLFAVTTLATIGYGFIAPKTETGRIICIFYSVFGIPIMMIAVANLGLWFAGQVRRIYRILFKLLFKDVDENSLQEVPVLVSLVIMAMYIFGGAGLFAKWEGFRFVDGAYFSFVTLTTIGYGDIVPGVYKGKGDWVMTDANSLTGEKAVKLIICCVYLFFGLAILAMCMDLMKEEVRANFLWLGYKTKLIAQKSPDEVIKEYVKQQTGG